MGKQTRGKINVLVVHFARGAGGHALARYEVTPKVISALKKLLNVNEIDYNVYNYMDETLWARIDAISAYDYIIVLAPRHTIRLDGAIVQLSKHNDNIIVVLPHENENSYPTHDEASVFLRYWVG